MVDLSSGACAGRADQSYQVADPFFPAGEKGPGKGPDYKEAAEICGRCRIRDICLQDALTETVQWGYRGGMTPEDRATLKTGKPSPVPMRRHAPTEQELEQRMAWYCDGWSDVEIGDRQGVTAKAIRTWRFNNNLPCNNPTNPPHTEEQVRVKWELYNTGAADKVIAQAIGVAPEAIRRWRRREGLESNRTRMQVPA